MGMKARSKKYGYINAGGFYEYVPNSNKIAGFEKRKNKKPIFDEFGHVTFERISARREFFLGKSAARLEHELNKHGYKTCRRPSVHRGSKAKFIITLNPSKNRNVTQIQVSSGSKRHGNVAYVKISTSDFGKIKIIADNRTSYKTDGKETAKLLFRRATKK